MNETVSSETCPHEQSEVLRQLCQDGGLVSRSEAETKTVGAVLGVLLTGRVRGLSWERGIAQPRVLLLEGDMGTGKTVLVSGIAEALSIEPRQVQSPTFTLINEYPDRAGTMALTHCDLYRLESSEVESTGLFDLMDHPERITVVEWAERLGRSLPGAVTLRLSRVQSTSDERNTNRRIVMSPPHPLWP